MGQSLSPISYPSKLGLGRHEVRNFKINENCANPGTSAGQPSIHFVKGQARVGFTGQSRNSKNVVRQAKGHGRTRLWNIKCSD